MSKFWWSWFSDIWRYLCLFDSISRPTWHFSYHVVREFQADIEITPLRLLFWSRVWFILNFNTYNSGLIAMLVINQLFHVSFIVRCRSTLVLAVDRLEIHAVIKFLWPNRYQYLKGNEFNIEGIFSIKYNS